MTMKMICWFLFCLMPFISVAQDSQSGCAAIKNGVFYFYPKNGAERYMDIREGELLHETNMTTGDTSAWQVKWTGDCTYSLQYISGNNKMSAEMQQFVKQHQLVFQVTNISGDYYIFKGYVDKTSNPPVQTDTMWLHEKTSIASNELFRQVKNSALLKRAHFSDTSRYAVVYLYRPGKLTNSLGNYLVYFDDIPMCVAKNKSGYIFKVLKEGKFEVKSKLYKDESVTVLDVKFGSTYYVKSMIHWTISSRLYNFKLEMAVVKPDRGQMEFEEVNLQ